MKVNRSVFYKRKRNPSYILLWCGIYQQQNKQPCVMKCRKVLKFTTATNIWVTVKWILRVYLIEILCLSSQIKLKHIYMDILGYKHHFISIFLFFFLLTGGERYANHCQKASTRLFSLKLFVSTTADRLWTTPYIMIGRNSNFISVLYISHIC